MHLDFLSLRHFRNYQSLELDLSGHTCTAFLGPNAQGKTNLLESIYLLSFLNSYRTHKVTELIQKGESAAVIEARFLNAAHIEWHVLIRIDNKGKKTLLVNGQPQRKLSAYIGSIKIVYFSSHDMRMMWGSPQDRRRFMDLFLIQLYPRYFMILKKYRHILKQRNQLLKKFKQGQLGLTTLNEELEVWDLQLSQWAAMIMTQRMGLIRYIKPVVGQIYTDISASANVLSLVYQTELKQERCEGLNKDEMSRYILQVLHDKRKEELQRGQTVIGPHRDDFCPLLDGHEIQTYGSQGQTRMATMALKIAELICLGEHVKDSPLLLLDDVFSELDLERQRALISYIQAAKAQILLTTTHLPTDVAESLMRLSPHCMNVQAGHLYPYETNS